MEFRVNEREDTGEVDTERGTYLSSVSVVSLEVVCDVESEG